MTIATIAVYTMMAMAISGCGGAGDSAPVPVSENSSISYKVGYYGVANDLGSSDTIRITWDKKTEGKRLLVLEPYVSAGVKLDTSHDYILETLFTDASSKAIGEVVGVGKFTFVCDPVLWVGEYTKYTCFAENASVDYSIGNVFVLPTKTGAFAQAKEIFGVEDVYGTYHVIEEYLMQKIYSF
jgi:hypothetical protein